MSSRLEPYRLKYNPGKGTASAKVRHKKMPNKSHGPRSQGT